MVEDCKLTKKPQAFTKKEFKKGIFFHDEIDEDIKSNMKNIEFEEEGKFWVPVE